MLASNPAVPAFFRLQEKKLGRLGSRLAECDYYRILITAYTVDREVFAVKIFSPVALAAKIKRAKIFLCV